MPSSGRRRRDSARGWPLRSQRPGRHHARIPRQQPPAHRRAPRAAGTQTRPSPRGQRLRVEKEPTAPGQNRSEMPDRPQRRRVGGAPRTSSLGGRTNHRLVPSLHTTTHSLRTKPRNPYSIHAPGRCIDLLEAGHREGYETASYRIRTLQFSFDRYESANICCGHGDFSR